jgi:hypothetical protein
MDPKDRIRPQDEKYMGRSFHHGRFIQNLRRACMNTKK